MGIDSKYCTRNKDLAIRKQISSKFHFFSDSQGRTVANRVITKRNIKVCGGVKPGATFEVATSEIGESIESTATVVLMAET